MSGFPALNIEPEEDNTEDIDDTREIQLEEALKLYQNALRLHSFGPECFAQAADAYRDLFNSEIFRYPEAVSEFTRDELDSHTEDTPVVDQNLSQLNVVPPAIVQASPSSLPQIIYLSFKNYGQFLLEQYSQAASPHRPGLNNTSVPWAPELVLACSKALKQFAEALERDDTDLDLWRKAARVAQVCVSDRIFRFCLESVLAEDDEGSGEVVEILGLDEALAAGLLREVVDTLGDDLSSAQSSTDKPKGDLLKLLKKTIDPFPSLPSPSHALQSRHQALTSLNSRPKRRVVRASAHSWDGIGQALLQSLNDEQQFNLDHQMGASLYIDLPGEPESEVVSQPADDPGRADAETKSAKPATTIAARQEIEMVDCVSEPLVNGDESTFNTEMASHTERDPILASNTAVTPLEAQAETGEELCQRGNPGGEDPELTMTTRKRSVGSAGHDEPPDNGRSKSKRLRNREPNADAILQEEEVANTFSQYYDDQLRDLAAADQWLFSTAAGLLSRLQIDGPVSLEGLRSDIIAASLADCAPEQNIPADAVSMKDIRSVLMSWSDERANSVTFGQGSSTFGGGKAGLTLFLEHSKTAIPRPASMLPFTSSKGVSLFIGRCNEGYLNLYEVVLDWLQALIRSTVLSDACGTNIDIEPSSYTNSLWPEALKLTVVQLIVRDDEHIYQVMQQRLDNLANRLLSHSPGSAARYTLGDVTTADMAQTLYELHLDIYSRITNPSSQVDNATRILQRDRLKRWSDLAGSFINIYADHADDVPSQQWHVIRYIWTATTHANMADEPSQEHMTLCLKDLHMLLNHAGKPVIILPNNAAIPEISVSAVEQEISRISTLDFFIGIFNDDLRDPIALIESLEPILEPRNEGTLMECPAEGLSQHSPSVSAQTQKLVGFLESGDASLKVFLLRRLRDAYAAIDYSPKVVSCYLRSIEAIVSELSSQRHLRLPNHARELAAMKWIKELDGYIAKLLDKALAEPNAFDVVDESHLQISMSSVARLARLLHSVALYEDAVRVGKAPEPRGKNASGSKSLEKFRDKLRNMHVRVWTLQYTLLKEGIAQNRDRFESSADDQAEYLRALHNALGLRGYCKHSNKIFLRLLKSELMTLDTKEDYSAEMAQVLFDLHQLKFTTGIGDLNHDCPPEPLDKKSAAHILGTVVLQARRMNIKDLLKSELKGTIDKIQQALGTPKSTSLISHNRRIINAYLKAPINQLQLFCASRGQVGLAVRAVETESANVSALGWYFLLGGLSLAKFKSMKRVNQGPTDDLDIAVSFLKQDLEHGVEKWETWFRLGQAYDAKIEEDLLWTAEKVNSHRPELANLQRNAIHCYEMAMAASIRTADDTTETASKISEMYTGFATRLYSSSREPLSMDAFDTQYHQRHYSSSTEQSNLYQGPSTPSMRMFSVWRFAAHLLRRALAEKPQNWINHYLLGKCLWKMLTKPEPQSRRKVQIEEVVDAFSEAIESLPERKDSRADRILEPHFKLVSVVHKLVHRKMLTPLQGRAALQATTWARGVHLPEEEDSWEPYVLGILRKIGHADKSNWHHRIIARAAHVIYDDQKDNLGALGAKHEFTQQIFTKTMTLQVWKPEYERAGRHFVYTSRYVLFFVSLLNQLNDRTSLDQLVRRIRRKPGDYLNHLWIWEQVITSYVGLLRRVAQVPAGHEEAVFRTLDHDQFVANAARLETHAHDPQTSNLVLDILRDAVELKKLNNSLMKGPLIDDLIVDCYASLYQNFALPLQSDDMVDPEGSTIPLQSVSDVRKRELMRLGNILTAQADGNAELPGFCEPPTTQRPPAHSGIPAPPTKSARPKTVTRREVLRKAEGLIVRPPPIKTPTILKHLILPRQSVTAEAQSPSDKQPRSSPTIEPHSNTVGLGLGPVEGSRVADLVREDADGAQSANSSRPGSVYDSADDESELSELEEIANALDDDVAEGEEQDKAPKQSSTPAVLFPGLAPRTGDDDNEGSSVVISDSDVAWNEQQERVDVDQKQRAPDMTDTVEDALQE
jgi:hypothetical protein